MAPDIKAAAVTVLAGIAMLTAFSAISGKGHTPTPAGSTLWPARSQLKDSLLDLRTPRDLASLRYDVPVRLNEVTRHYSLGVGEVRCPPPAEWQAFPGSYGAWGVTNVRDDWAALAPFICQGALRVSDPAVPLWQQAAGVWVLVHESFHLRHWRYRKDEGKVSCQTIVYFTEAAEKLGATEIEANELFPYALALYDRQGRIWSWYRDPECLVPIWLMPPEPTAAPG